MATACSLRLPVPTSSIDQMGEEIDDLDEVRHQHHLRHRSRLDQRLTQLAWLLISIFLAARAIQRTYGWWRRRSHRKHRLLRRNYISTPAFMVKTVVFFEAVSLLSLPRLFGSTTISISPLGKILFCIAFTCIIGALIVSVDAPRFSSHFLDDVAFRAAWITLAQVPLVFLLATKRGPLNVLAALSYERISWIHRWTGRVLFLSASIHMGIMMQSISVSEVISSPNKIMIIVRYGAGAYGTLTWIALSSILPLRNWSYRLFYINHWTSTSVFLWVLFKHIPKYARPAVYLSIGILFFDRCLSYYSLFRNNVSIRVIKRRFSKFRKGPNREAITMGHLVEMSTPPVCSSCMTNESTTVIRICNVPFSWKPGQHIRLYLPKLGGFEVHPFTPATCSQASSAPISPSKIFDIENDRLLAQSNTPESPSEMVLFIRPHAGLTRKLAEYYSEWLSCPCPNASQPSLSLTAFIDGPYGTPPAWEEHESLALISTSTGVSFTLSIMDYLEQVCMDDPSRLRTKHIRFIWTIRHLEPQFDATVTDMLRRHGVVLREAGIAVTAEFYATCPRSKVVDSPRSPPYDQFAHLRRHRRRYLSGRPPLRIYHPDRLYEEEEEEEGEEDEDEDEEEEEEEEKEVEEWVEEPELSDTQSWSSFETYASSTLIDEEEEQELPPGSFWTQFSSPLFNGAPTDPHPDPSPTIHTQYCECARVQSQLQKSDSTAPSPDFITRFYGSRPDIQSSISSSASSTTKEKTMVAVCSNGGVVARARNQVARMNFDFVAGRREAGVAIFSECFG